MRAIGTMSAARHPEVQGEHATASQIENQFPAARHGISENELARCLSTRGGQFFKILTGN